MSAQLCLPDCLHAAAELDLRCAETKGSPPANEHARPLKRGFRPNRPTYAGSAFGRCLLDTLRRPQYCALREAQEGSLPRHLVA